MNKWIRVLLILAALAILFVTAITGLAIYLLNEEDKDRKRRMSEPARMRRWLNHEKNPQTNNDRTGEGKPSPEMEITHDDLEKAAKEIQKELESDGRSDT